MNTRRYREDSQVIYNYQVRMNTRRYRDSQVNYNYQVSMNTKVVDAGGVKVEVSSRRGQASRRGNVSDTMQSSRFGRPQWGKERARCGQKLSTCGPQGGVIGRSPSRAEHAASQACRTCGARAARD